MEMEEELVEMEEEQTCQIRARSSLSSSDQHGRNRHPMSDLITHSPIGFARFQLFD